MSPTAFLSSTARPLPHGGQALLVSELFPPTVGGSAVLLHGIYSRVRGATVSVLTHREGADPAAVPELRDRLQVHHSAIATSRWGIANPRALAHHVGVARRIRRLCPRRGGLVHCARALPEGLAAMIARMLGGPRYICWAHGEDLVTAASSRELALLTGAIFRGASAALANSQNTASMLRAMGVPDDKVHVIYPAVDADRFHPRVRGAAVRQRFARDGDLLLLSVGRLQRRKGHDMAIRALGQVRQELPHVRYVIAGDGEERARLEQLARDCGVADRVAFAGVVPEADLPAYYAASDVFLLPNRVDSDGDLEGFGIVFLEAAASGKPVIGGDSGGVPEAVERDVTGLLVDGASPEAVAAALRDLCGSSERRRLLGNAGRIRARDQFSWSRAASAVSEIQARLTGGEHTPIARTIGS